MSLITDYGTLKASIASWLNRTDLGEQIPQFIALAERRLYRTLRSPANEAQFYYQLYEPTDTFVIPPRYLEAKAFVYNDKALERISAWDYDNRREEYPALQGVPRYFTRSLDLLKIWPAPAGGTTARLGFYADLSGLGTNASITEAGGDQDTDTNNVLMVSPDLYLFGALMMAGTYLGTQPEDRTQWQELYRSAYHEVSEMGKTEDMSGSLIVPTNFVGGYAR